MQTVKVEVEGHSYPVILGRGCLSGAGKELSQLLQPGKALVISDETVSSLYAERVLRSLEESGWECRLEILPPGEGSKTVETAQRMYSAAIEAGLERRSPVIALGGGVVGDLAGFVAATFLRGVPFVQIPTTLLSMVDSSVGGKVGVNHPRGKNLIGAFYQPHLVLIDLETLNTLDMRQFKAGMAEMVKYGVISDRQLWDWLEENMDALLERSEISLLEYPVTRSVEIKASVVNQDEKETDLRQVLNFGHTFGHALEAATQYRYYLHGEAVLVGMEMAARLACRLGMVSGKDCRRMTHLFHRIGVIPPPEDLKTREVAERLVYDKKRRGNRTVFILPREIGKVDIFSDIDEAPVREVIKEYLDLHF